MTPDPSAAGPEAGSEAGSSAGSSGPAAGTRDVRSAVCTRCGCACDDVDLTVRDGRILEARNVCDLGRPWFLTPPVTDDPAARVDGREVSLEDGAEAAARLLAGARRPLVWGLIHLASEAQRVAVAIADRVRGVIDPAAGPNHPAAVTAFSEWGEVAATLGEPANHRGLIVLWHVEPERTHPRLLGRWAVDPADDDRLIRFRHGDVDAERWTIPPHLELQFLWVLRRLARERPAVEAPLAGAEAARRHNEAGAAGPREGAAGAGSEEPVEDLARRFLARIAAAPHVTFAFEAAEADAARQHALRALAATLNRVTRFRLAALRGGGNRGGAEAVLLWQTGFPVAVDFGGGAPRANGGEFSAPRLLERGEIDAALVVCANPDDFAGEPGLARLAEVPVAVLDSSRNPLEARARVVLRSAPYGLASGGTFFRMDGVALGLRPALEPAYPSEAQWLSRILAHLSAAGTAGVPTAATEAGGGTRDPAARTEPTAPREPTGRTQAPP